VNDLDPVVLLKQGRAPVVAAHDAAVEFDSDTRRRQIELSN
jgi:hypothetical protein